VALKLATLLALWVGFARSRHRDLVRWSAAAVAAYVAFEKVLSPQFLIGSFRSSRLSAAAAASLRQRSLRPRSC
jgi:hypothetical protein